MINFNCIEDKLFLGSTPQTSVDVARLAQMKVTAVLSLQSDEDHRAHRIDWKKMQSAYSYNELLVRRFPIIDFDEADLAAKLDSPVQALQELLSQGHRVYVHCNAGVSRAPATVLGYLCRYRGMSLQDGLEYIRRERPQANPYLGAVQKMLDAGSA